MLGSVKKAVGIKGGGPRTCRGAYISSGNDHAMKDMQHVYLHACSAMWCVVIKRAKVWDV